jgi:hypothetical protein
MTRLLAPLLRAAALVLSLLLADARATHAQSSPVVDILLRARMALNDLRHSDADSLSQFVLDIFGSRMNREQRLDALSIAAAARYPEPILGATQHPERALDALRQLVRMDPDAKLRDELRWSGLDSLYVVARASTFAARMDAPRDIELSAGESAVVVSGMSTRPARWRVELTSIAGVAPAFSTTLESTVSPSVRLQVALDRGQPSIATGAYTLRVTALDAASLDSATWTFRAIVDAPPVVLDPLPDPIDPSRFRPEIAPKARTRGIVLGVALGAVTIAGVQALRGNDELASQSDLGSNGMIVGGSIAIGAVIAGFLDKGLPLPANAAANERLRSDHEVARRLVEAENSRRLAAFRANIAFEAPAP